jgi:hypothetical protein
MTFSSSTSVISSAIHCVILTVVPVVVSATFLVSLTLMLRAATTLMLLAAMIFVPATLMLLVCAIMRRVDNPWPIIVSLLARI